MPVVADHRGQELVEGRVEMAARKWPRDFTTTVRVCAAFGRDFI
ncbi:MULTISPECIES: hypothetical protein [Cupriavidus]|nr:MULTISPECIES: hypothetical protein [Cupriavidus]